MNRLHTFLEAIRTQSNQTQGHNIMLTMGSDFQVSAKVACVLLSTYFGSHELVRIF
jgi:hypothetical protein